LIAISTVVIGAPVDDSDPRAWRIVRAGLGRGAPTLAWSGQRMPTGAKTMQSGQMPRPHSEQETIVSRLGCR
jgi:hypothetical protein